MIEIEEAAVVEAQEREQRCERGCLELILAHNLPMYYSFCADTVLLSDLAHVQLSTRECFERVSTAFYVYLAFVYQLSIAKLYILHQNLP